MRGRRRGRCKPKQRDEAEGYERAYSSLGDTPFTPKGRRAMGQTNSRQDTPTNERKTSEIAEVVVERPLVAAPKNRVESLKENFVREEKTSAPMAVEPSIETEAPRQVGTQSEAERSLEPVDVLAMEVPRRPRSKRNTTVVKLANFSFRDLPALYNGGTQSQETPASKPPVAAVGENGEEKVRRKAPRKPKSDAAPQRVVFDDAPGIRRGLPRKSRMRTQTGLLLATSIDKDDAFFTEDLEFTPWRVTEKRRPYQRRTLGKTSKRDGGRKRSLRAIIDNCVQQRQTRNVQALPAAFKPMTDSPMVIPQRSHQEFRTEAMLTAAAHVDCCPTVSCLLTKGVLQAGDYVELVPVDSKLTIHGWVTHRGILCSHCALVHSCKQFGACADCKAPKSQLRIKDGRSFSQLLR